MTVADVTQDLTPAENLVLRSVGNSTFRLAQKLSDSTLKFIGAMRAAGYQTRVDGTVPDQLREHIMATAVWTWLRGFPQLKNIKTKEREDAAKDAKRVYERICARTYGAIEDPNGTDFTTGNWNSESKLIMRTHPIPQPQDQFSPINTDPMYANPNADQDMVPTTPTQVVPGVAFIFDGPAGTTPPFEPLVIGQEAINEQTNEDWFVDNEFTWQQDIGA